MNSKRIWTIAGVLVVVAVLVLGWVIGVSPFLAQASVADTEREGVEAVNDVELAKLEQMKELYAEIDDLRVDLALLRVSVPGEADTDFLYSLLAGIQTGSGANVATIATGEAVPYGAAGAAAATASTTPAAAAVPSLYTVPVTVTFDGVEAAKVLAFADAMQSSPRLFLVTGVTGDGAQSSTITAYMFVLYDANSPRGAAAEAYAGMLPSPKVTGKTPAPVVEPTAEPTPGATGAPTPTPTGTPTP